MIWSDLYGNIELTNTRGVTRRGLYKVSIEHGTP